MFAGPVRLGDEEKSPLYSDYAALTSNSAGKDCVLPVPNMNLGESMRNHARSLLPFITPSFLQEGPEYQHTASTGKYSQSAPSQSNSTRYLDGVRGVASLIVFIFHFSHMEYPGTNKGFGVDGHDSVWQLPVVRLVYSGAAMVSIFFVVSGYVLSHRYLEMIRACEYERFNASLASLAFRRAFRLFLPALASILLQFVVGAIFPAILPKKVNGKQFHPGLAALLQNIDRLMNPWTWEPYMDGGYNPQLWSVALEYRGSMVVFVTLLALSRTQLVGRLMVEISMIVHAFAHKRWDVALFTSGMLMAELDVHIHSSPVRATFMRKKGVKLCLLTSLLLGIWLSGFPRDEGIQSYGYAFLGQVWPFGEYRRRFWLGISAILVVAPMPYLPSIQQFFNCRIAVYLGKISFSLYLIHGLGNRTVGSWLLHSTHQILGNKGYWACATSFAITSILYLPLIIWSADVFWRAVDLPSMRLAKWIEQKTCRIS